jgi:hypothetical protein
MQPLEAAIAPRRLAREPASETPRSGIFVHMEAVMTPTLAIVATVVWCILVPLQVAAAF